MSTTKKHLSIAKEVGDRAGEGLAFGNLGDAYLRLGDFKQAIKSFEKHLNIAKEVGDKTGEGNAHGNLGNAYSILGDVKQAIENVKQHLRIAKEIGDRAGEVTSYGSLGNAYLKLGNFKEAVEYHEHYLSICKEIGNYLRIAWYLLGHNHELSGSLSNALNCYRLSITYFNETRPSLKSKDEWKILSFRNCYCESYTALWRTLLKNGEIDEALYAAEKRRAQALMDILKEQYGIDSRSFSEFAPKQTLSAALELYLHKQFLWHLTRARSRFWC